MTVAKKQNRIYLVGHGQDMRLVRASHRAQALGHVARSLINVKVASQEELVHAMQHGIKIESATETDTNDLFDTKDEHQAAE